MYLHCHNCEWSQDDFWDKGYNPLKYLLDWEQSLLNKADLPFPGEKDTAGMTYAQVIAREMKQGADVVLSMKWHTHEDYLKAKEDGTLICPKCGSTEHFDID